MVLTCVHHIAITQKKTGKAMVIRNIILEKAAHRNSIQLDLVNPTKPQALTLGKIKMNGKIYKSRN